MTVPSPDQLAKFIDPTTRAYIDGRLQRLQQEQEAQMTMLRAQLKTFLDRADQQISEGVAALKSIEHKVDTDPAFELTRARVIALCKELKI